MKQGDVLTFHQSLLIDVDAFICRSDFEIDHFTLFSVMAALEKGPFSNCPRFRLNKGLQKV